jgi:hypothetical protein
MQYLSEITSCTTEPLLTLQQEGYSSEYPGSMYQDQYSTPATSPPTPSTANNDMMRTRSGYSIPRVGQNQRPKPEARPRVEKMPKPKKAKKEKASAERKIAKLDRPLSELTKDWTHIPVVDIEAYVNRSVEERRREVENGKCPGKVKRPMNSFMLYRKAYQNRTKDWCLQNNHQVVSQVCGDSWPLEPDSVKEQFSEWARIERQNHQNAHPGYKFSPAKPGAAKAATKRKVSQDPLSEESDLEDFEWEAAPPRRPKRQRSTPIQEQSVSYPTTRPAYQYLSKESSVEFNNGGYNKSSYQATNPGRPIPAQYNQANLDDGQYYQQSVQSNPNIAGVEDVIIRKTATPGVHSYLGLPGGPDLDMMNPYPRYEGRFEPELRIDPSLVGQDEAVYGDEFFNGQQHDGIYFGGSADSPSGDQNWQQPYDIEVQPPPNRQDQALNYLDPALTMNDVHINDPNMPVLKGPQDGWHVESLEANQEFEKWMNEEG